MQDRPSIIVNGFKTIARSIDDGRPFLDDYDDGDDDDSSADSGDDGNDSTLGSVYFSSDDQ